MANRTTPEQNGGMFVSPDVIGMIISLFAFAVAMLGGVAWLLGNQTKRVDAGFDQVDARFDQVDARFDRVDTRIDGLDARLNRVENELVEVKIAIARIEGPERRLQRL